MTHFSAKLLGVAGVSKYENARAKRLAGYFEWPMVAVAIWIRAQWYLTTLDVLPGTLIIVLDWLVWGLFLIETLWVCGLVKNKRRYLLGNWINPMITILGCPAVWQSVLFVGSVRGLRLLVLLGVLMKLSRSGQRILSRNQLGATLLVSMVVILFAGVFISLVDPAFHTPWEGIWWAWVTVTTVGYGDFVPVSPVGRVFGGLLILLGICLFALLTANFSAALIGQEVAESDREMEAVEREEEKILEILGKIDNRLDRLEQRVEEIQKKEHPSDL